MKREQREHDRKVSEIKQILADLNLPSLPLNTVYSAFFRTDIVTRIDTKFIPIDFINTRERIPIDIGGLCLIYNKDIVDFSLAVIADSLWQENLRDLRLAKLNLPPRLNLIPFREIREYFRKLSL